MRYRTGLAFAVYCVIAGGTWFGLALLTPVWPDLLRLSVHDFVLAVLFACAALYRRRLFSRHSFEAGAWCALLFAGLPVVSAAATGSVGALTQVLVSTLIAVFTVFLVAQQQNAEDGLHLLVPVLCGIGGLALLLSFALPSSASGWGWLMGEIAMALLLAVAGLRLHRLLRTQALLPVAAFACGIAAILAGMSWRLFQSSSVTTSAGTLWRELAWAVLVDGPLVVLTLWLARRLGPAAFSARFLLIPWVTITGGWIVMRQALNWTDCLGLVLTLAAGLFVAAHRRGHGEGSYMLNTDGL